MTDAQHAAVPIEVPARTPLYQALDQPRYTRQELIRSIEQRSGRRLVCYVAGLAGALSQFDVPPFVDLLTDVERGADLDLLLHTGGGDVDQAERITMMCRKRVGSDGSFRVIVPDSAKSAGTLIAIGADEIVMGEPSELGPIDPQIEITTASGERMARPAQSFLDGLNAIIDAVGDAALSAAYFPLLDKLDPALIDFCKKAIRRSEELAERALSRYMLRDDPKLARKIAKRLNDSRSYLSHGAVIDAQEALDLGLRILELPPRDDLWEAYWRLYCQCRLALREPHQRLFEGRRASLLLP